MCSSPGRALALQARARSNVSFLCFRFLMIPRISGNLLLARSNPRSIQKERMAVWSRGLHGAKALTIRFESAVLPTAKLLNWQRTSEFDKQSTGSSRVPSRQARNRGSLGGCNSGIFSPAAVRCGIGRIGWHTFRHTFRSLLDETGAPLKVQQELMRHCRHPNNDEHLWKSHREEQS